MPATLEQAIAAVRASYGDSRWLSLDVAEQTRAIYREMRRLDLEETMVRRAVARAAIATPEADLPQGVAFFAQEDAADPPTEASPRCSAFIKTRSADRCTWQPVTVHEGRSYCGFHNPLRQRIPRNCEATKPSATPADAVFVATGA
ncbi:MAG: hypothetical protein P4L71_15695 [Acetobacteraceae bacterium]|nr:hypothetical protein [Acetobacteraceae bacterium]